MHLAEINNRKSKDLNRNDTERKGLSLENHPLIRKNHAQYFVSPCLMRTDRIDRNAQHICNFLIAKTIYSQAEHPPTHCREGFDGLCNN